MLGRSEIGGAEAGAPDRLAAPDGLPAADSGAAFAGCPAPEPTPATWPGGRADHRRSRSGAVRYCEQSDGQLDSNSTDNRSDDAREEGDGHHRARALSVLDSDGRAPVTLPLCLVRGDGKPVATGAGTSSAGR